MNRIKFNPLTLGILATVSVSLVLGSGKAIANPGEYALQPVCDQHSNSGGVICYTPQTAPVLRLGSRGKLVSNVQGLMKALGYLGTSSDGIYGAQTRTAMMRFQRANGITPDGVVGARTWMAIMRANAG